MKYEDALPSQFKDLAGQVSYVRQTRKGSHPEWHGSCPNCGGTVHPDGDWPDRFTMWLTCRAYDGPLGWCRVCGFKWWPGKTQGVVLSQETKRKWAEELRQRAEEERREAERKYQRVLRFLEAQRPWIEYNENLGEQGSEPRMLWEKRGIPYTWQQLWSLGYDPSFKVFYGKNDDDFFHTPTLTIPIFQPKADYPQNIVHRLLRPQNHSGTYRQQFSGLLPLPWIADTDKPMDTYERVLVVEGQIKAMVTYITLEDAHLQVMGIQGKNSWELLVEPLKKKDVWVLLDPDAQKQAAQLSQLLGAKNISLQGKVDDLINNGWLTKGALVAAMRGARKL